MSDSELGRISAHHGPACQIRCKPSSHVQCSSMRSIRCCAAPGPEISWEAAGAPAAALKNHERSVPPRPVPPCAATGAAAGALGTAVVAAQLSTSRLWAFISAELPPRCSILRHNFLSLSLLSASEASQACLSTELAPSSRIFRESFVSDSLLSATTAFKASFATKRLLSSWTLQDMLASISFKLDCTCSKLLASSSSLS
mmetsp:Transcript_27667/g.45310  ORF Transcript_27667/g.45310 Transcript_27667/m.45310 type:complete len:200 (-) Transcript_27667:344-943(-)